MKRNIVNKDAVKEMEQTIEDYVWDADDDQEMLDMYEADRADLRKVLDLYKKRQWVAAYKFARSMDTAPREYIPMEIFEDIQSA